MVKWNDRRDGKRIRRKAVCSFAAAVMSGLFLCVGMAGCGSADKSAGESFANYQYEQKAEDTASAGMAYDAAEDEIAAEDTNAISVEGLSDADYGFGGTAGESAAATTAESGTNGEAVPVKDGKKIIKRYEYHYETEHFDDAYVFLRERIEEYNGYISSSNTNGTSYRTLYLTARIPADVSDAFIAQLGSLGTILNQSESADDVTLQYTDTESRIKALRTEQERLNDLLEKADSLETIIALEDRLTEVRYELESYQSQKNLYDDLISYSTVSITLDEVSHTVEAEDSFLARISAGLRTTCWNIKDGLTDFVVWLIVNVPYLFIWGMIILIAVKIIAAVRKRRKAKRERKQELEQADVEREQMSVSHNETDLEEEEKQEEE